MLKYSLCCNHTEALTQNGAHTDDPSLPPLLYLRWWQLQGQGREAAEAEAVVNTGPTLCTLCTQNAHAVRARLMWE